MMPEQLPLYGRPIQVPGVEPQDRKRLTRQANEILARLKRGNLTCDDLQKIAKNYTARISELRQAIPRALESEAYRDARRQIETDLHSAQHDQFQQLDAQARERGFTVMRTASGLALVPLKEGQPIPPEAFGQLPAEEQRRLTAVHRELEQAMAREQLMIEDPKLLGLLQLVKLAGIVPDLSEVGMDQPPKVEVLPGSLAEKAGIRSGDRITALNGQTVKRIEDVPAVWSQLTLHGGLRLSLQRDGSQVELTLADWLKGLIGTSDQDAP